MSLSQADGLLMVRDETAQQTLCVVRSSIEAHGRNLPEATTEDRVPARPRIDVLVDMKLYGAEFLGRPPPMETAA